MPQSPEVTPRLELPFYTMWLAAVCVQASAWWPAGGWQSVWGGGNY